MLLSIFKFKYEIQYGQLQNGQKIEIPLKFLESHLIGFFYGSYFIYCNHTTVINKWFLVIKKNQIGKMIVESEDAGCARGKQK